MRKHVFVARPANVSPRWLEAFPDARVTSATPDVGADGAFVGLGAELPDWRTRLAALAATPGCDVVLLSLQPDDGEALAAFELGARAYAHALATPAMLREVDAVVAHGGLWVGPALMARLLRALSARPSLVAPKIDVLDGLSARERSVAEAVAEGLSNKEIALRLALTERTVKAHLAAVFDKLGVRDRLQLVVRIGASLRANAAADVTGAA
jgi:two-component system nitrate/nitrite response regulator NarL